MIKVVFKKNKEIGFDNLEFVYANYEGINVDDIVVVNTRYGYGIAKVTAIDVNDERFKEDELATVKCIIEGKAEREAKETRKKIIEGLIKQVKRNKIMNEIKELGVENDEIIKDMKDDELKEFLRAIKY